jgi:hypothetical protein
MFKKRIFATIVVTGSILHGFVSCGSPNDKAVEYCTLHGDQCHTKGDTGDQGPDGPQGVPGPVGQPGTNGSNGSSCSAAQEATGVRVTCTDGTGGFVTNGTNGATGTQGATGTKGDTGTAGTNGTNGTNGSNGLSVVFAMTAATVAQCANGGSVIALAQDFNANGVLDPLDTGIQTTIICNGAKGDTGAQGQPSQFTPTAPIRPCGPTSSPWKEVLLCLSDGEILASFSDDMAGDNTRLSMIPPGSYVDTDSSGCYFTVATAGSGLLVSWNAGSNQYATWTAGSAYCGP